MASLVRLAIAMHVCSVQGGKMSIWGRRGKARRVLNPILPPDLGDDEREEQRERLLELWRIKKLKLGALNAAAAATKRYPKGEHLLWEEVLG